jgi:aminodeoxyfutalosine deaminase
LGAICQFCDLCALKKWLPTQLFDGHQFWPSQTVLVTDEAGTIVDLVHGADAEPGVQHLAGLLCPGFVNVHCHLELSHLKNVIAPGEGLPAFILEILAKRGAPEETMLAAMEAAVTEMKAAGIVAVGDIANQALSAQVKAQYPEMAWYHFVEASGWNPNLASPRFAAAQAVEAQTLALMPRALSSLNPHAPYSVSPALWQLLQQHFPGKTITLHHQETAAENELFETGRGGFVEMYQKLGIDQGHFVPTGTRSATAMAPLMQKAQHRIWVHNSFTTAQDLHDLAPTEQDFFCLCPTANQYIENTLPPVDLFREQGVNLVLGTDSLASNNQLSIWAEVQTLRTAFPHLPLAEVLQWATLNGAQALQMDDQLGSFAPGKKPGLVNIHQDKVFRLL